MKNHYYLPSLSLSYSFLVIFFELYWMSLIIKIHRSHWQKKRRRLSSTRDCERVISLVISNITSQLLNGLRNLSFMINVCQRTDHAANEPLYTLPSPPCFRLCQSSCLDLFFIARVIAWGLPGLERKSSAHFNPDSHSTCRCLRLVWTRPHPSCFQLVSD